MAGLTTTKRDHLRDGSFAYIDKGGDRHLPINDAPHVRNAIARFGQTEFESATAKHQAARRIVAAARRYEIEVAADDDVMRASRR